MKVKQRKKKQGRIMKVAEQSAPVSDKYMVIHSNISPDNDRSTAPNVRKRKQNRDEFREFSPLFDVSERLCSLPSQNKRKRSPDDSPPNNELNHSSHSSVNKKSCKKKKVKKSSLESSFVEYDCVSPEQNQNDTEKNEIVQKIYADEASCSNSIDSSLSSSDENNLAPFLRKINVFDSDDEMAETLKQKSSEETHSYGVSESILDFEEESVCGDESEEESSDRESESKDVLHESFSKETSNISSTESFPAVLDKSPVCFRVPHKSAEILVLRHPSSVFLCKYIRVTVLSGGVSVLGWEMVSTSPSVDLFSFPKTGLLELKTTCTETIGVEPYFPKKLQRRLTKRFSLEVANKVLWVCNHTSVVVVLERVPLPAPLHFVHLYYSALFKSQQNFCGFYMNVGVRNAITFNEFDEEKVEAALKIIRKSTYTTEPKSKIIVYGPNQSGKSYFIRFMINRILSDRNFKSKVCYLDTDPGQTEFFPPGTVSLTTVTEPLIGPSFTHLKTPEHAIFIGSCTVDKCVTLYEDSIVRLMKRYEEDFNDHVLIVNTMGWTTGLGLECLKHIIKTVQPNILIEVLETNSRPVFDFTAVLDFVPRNVNYIKFLSKASKSRDPSLKGVEKRNLTVVSYLGQCFRPHMRPSYLNDLQGWCVSYDDIPIYVLDHTQVMPNEMVEAINGSFVALCRVSESAILENDIPHYAKTVKRDAVNECIGFGVVKFVNKETRQLNVVTPLSYSELKYVNCIMKGDILLPDKIYILQPLMQIPFNYTMQHTSEKSQSFQKIPKRLRR